VHKTPAAQVKRVRRGKAGQRTAREEEKAAQSEISVLLLLEDSPLFPGAVAALAAA